MAATSINRVVLTGYLTRDPKIECLPSGASVCNVRIGCSVRRRNSASGEWAEKPNFFDVVVFGGQGETVARFLRKGAPIAVDGRLDWREWETRDGRRAQDVSIIAETVQFIGRRPGAPAGEDGAQETGDGRSDPDLDLDESLER
jgi:single-strand DNA-binding protein